jgi:hypothetical protein
LPGKDSLIIRCRIALQDEPQPEQQWALWSRMKTLMLTPLLVPIVTAAGIGPIHFGIILTVNLSIGMFTPPSD